MAQTKRIVPITERSNELTTELDMASPEGIARLLRQGDAQLFSGYSTHSGLMDQDMIQNYARIAQKAAEAITANDKGVILMSGAGTSGRFAHLLARQFNRFLNQTGKADVFQPLVAGGSLALVKAQEGAEDDPIQGRADMINRIPDDAKSILYIGITCGLSAPYVAGQMDHLRDIPHATTVLLGFNPRETIRNVEVEGWNKTVKQAVDEFGASENFILLNPIYGPESVMGSTRMKGGTATKILLEAMFFAALELTEINTQASGSLSKKDIDDLAAIEKRITQFLIKYADTMQHTYSHIKLLGELVKHGGTTLRSGGRVNYLGRESSGIMGLIDASECPPTFGANFDDIRCFLRGGWPELMDDEDIDHSGAGPEFKIDLDSFETEKLPTISKGDFVLGLAIGELGPNVRMLLEAAKETKAAVGLLLITASSETPKDLPVDEENIYHIQIPSLGFVSGFYNFAELALKIALNALSTGAHVMIGKVYHNRMIDLKISNNKLYFRAIRTITLLAGVDEEVAKLALHRSVYGKDSLTSSEADAAPSTIIGKATGANRIVPVALLMAIGSMTFDQASKMLSQDPVPRRVINEAMESEKDAS